MDFSLDGISFFSLAASVIISFGLGFVWFNLLFGRQYFRELGKTKEELAKGPGMAHALSLQMLGFAAMGLVLAWLVSGLADGLLDGIVLGFAVWLGFVASVMGPLYAFQAFSLKLFLITSGYYLACLVLMGAFTAGWR